MNRIAVFAVLLLSSCTSVQTKIEIDAPAKEVRAVLLDFDDYPRMARSPKAARSG
jgi:hypothetical protein